MIHSAPTENVTVPLGQDSLATFNCLGDGLAVLWVINGTLVTHEDQSMYLERGITFPEEKFLRDSTSQLVSMLQLQETTTLSSTAVQLMVLL